MRAAVHARYGPPDVVRIADVAKPVPGDRDLLVKVRATTVNRTDCGYRGGKPFFLRLISGVTKPKATILGNEFAGEVEAVGGGVTSFQVGDRVFGYSEGAFGGHAEHMTVPEDGTVATVPPHLSFEDAAPSTEGAHYALAFLRTAKIRAGQDVLVNGASGGIGSAAVQLLRSAGANVTATCPGEHAALVRSLGADRVIDYTAEDFTEDDQTYDVVLDAVGKSSFGRCRRVLRPGGIYLSSELGPLAQNPFLTLVTPLLPGRTVKFPFPREDRRMATYIQGLLESGALRPVIDRRYPLDRIVEAYRYVESGQKIGNVVITVDPSGDP